jgi:anti-sigma-K factor RskA
MMTEQEFAELSAGHALHALSDADEQRYRDALDEHPEWGSRAAADADTVAALADAVPEVAPPATSRLELMALIAAMPQDDVRMPGDPGPGGSAEPAPSTATIQAIARTRWTRGLLALAASFALLVGAGFAAGIAHERLNRPASIVALEQIQGAPDAERATINFDELTATAYWSAELGRAVLVAQNLPELPEERSFELWYVRDEEPISAGVFGAEPGTASATAVLEGEYEPGDVIAVTVEQAGGSPDGQPTTDPIVAIPTA